MSHPTSLQLEAACLECLVSDTNFEGVYNTHKRSHSGSLSWKKVKLVWKISLKFLPNIFLHLPNVVSFQRDWWTGEMHIFPKTNNPRRIYARFMSQNKQSLRSQKNLCRQSKIFRPINISKKYHTTISLSDRYFPKRMIVRWCWSWCENGKQDSV